MELWHDRILVLDFGSQYTQLIARRIREAQVYSADSSLHRLRWRRSLPIGPRALSCPAGLPACMTRKRRRFPKQLFDQGIPILGICYGMQLVTHLSGGRRRSRRTHREYGRAELRSTTESDLFKGIGRREFHRRLDVAW